MKKRSDTPFISVVIPARNAEQLLPSCLESLNNLDYPREKFEVIIADGLSCDNTRKIAEEYGARVITNPGRTVVAGRNVGFEAARGELIAFSDVDCMMDKNWLRNSVKYFSNAKVACVGGPNLTPDNETVFGKAVGFVFNQRFFAAGSVHARVLKQIKEARSIPGCNAIYRREVLKKVMPMDEKLVEAEDAQMNQNILDLGYKLLYTPDVFLWHYRRSSPRKLWYQMYRYAIGRVIVGKRNPKMLNATYVGIGFAIPLLLIISIISYLVEPLYFALLWGLFIVAGLFFTFLALIQTKSLGIALNVPFVISIIALAWSFGFLRQLILSAKARKF